MHMNYLYDPESIKYTPRWLTLLQPVLHRPWSHIAIDFIAGAPVLEGNTMIKIINRLFPQRYTFYPFKQTSLHRKKGSSDTPAGVFIHSSSEPA